MQIPEPDIEGYRVGRCDVHFYVDGDSSDRITTFCAVCDAWMCEPCKDNLPKRALAWERRLSARLRNAIKKKYIHNRYSTS